MTKQYKSIGILGGMGPAATCDLMEKIVQNTDAEDDQHHIHLYVDCNVNIPDRTQAILYGGESPVEELVKSGKKLEQMGADFLVMPCHTAHHFYEEIITQFRIPMLDMTKQTALYLKEQGVQCVGLLATDGTLHSGRYPKMLKTCGIQTIYPKKQHQEMLMSFIYDGIKRGILEKEQLPYQSLQEMLHDLKMRGVQTCILACTELPIAFEKLGLTKHTTDPTLILARAAIRFAGATPKE